jgi:hypothetical protein
MAGVRNDPFHEYLQTSLRAFILPNMTLKTAALLALIGMILITVVCAVSFIDNLVGFLRDVTAAIALVTSLVHLLANLGLTVFLYVFHRAQSR